MATNINGIEYSVARPVGIWKQEDLIAFLNRIGEIQKEEIIRLNKVAEVVETVKKHNPGGLTVTVNPLKIV